MLGGALDLKHKASVKSRMQIVERRSASLRFLLAEMREHPG